MHFGALDSTTVRVAIYKVAGSLRKLDSLVPRLPGDAGWPVSRGHTRPHTNYCSKTCLPNLVVKVKSATATGGELLRNYRARDPGIAIASDGPGWP